MQVQGKLNIERSAALLYSDVAASQGRQGKEIWIPWARVTCPIPRPSNDIDLLNTTHLSCWSLCLCR